MQLRIFSTVNSLTYSGVASVARSGIAASDGTVAVCAVAVGVVAVHTAADGTVAVCVVATAAVT